MNFADTTALVAQYNEQFAKITQEFRAQMQNLISNVFVEFFKVEPHVQAISWCQYTPYFNDGEECIFGVQDVYFILEGLNVENVPDSPYEFEDDEQYVVAEKYGSDEEAYTENMKLLENLIIANSDIMKYAYGDHVMVVITPTETITNEFEHE